MGAFIEHFKNLLIDIENVFDVSGLMIPDDPINHFVNNLAEVVYKDNYWDESNNDRLILPGLTFKQIKDSPKFEFNNHVLKNYFKILYVSGYEDMKKFMGDEQVEFVNSKTAGRLFTELIESRKQTGATTKPTESNPGSYDALPEALKNTQIGKIASDIMKDIDIKKIDNSDNPMMATMQLLPDIMASFSKKMQNNEIDINQIQNESMGVLSQFMPMAKMMEPFIKQMMSNGAMQMPPHMPNTSGKNKTKKIQKKIENYKNKNKNKKLKTHHKKNKTDSKDKTEKTDSKEHT